jgi:hypothetical protein
MLHLCGITAVYREKRAIGDERQETRDERQESCSSYRSLRHIPFLAEGYRVRVPEPEALLRARPARALSPKSESTGAEVACEVCTNCSDACCYPGYMDRRYIYTQCIALEPSFITPPVSIMSTPTYSTEEAMEIFVSYQTACKSNNEVYALRVFNEVQLVLQFSIPNLH